MYYSDEKNAQIVVALLKANNIRKIVTSPGSTNIPVIQSVQCDGFFEVYSSVDERSAAYLACGLSSESGEAVALSCTGATASRNYLPGLTEAYYKKLPIIAITSINSNEYIGNLVAQTIDRTNSQNDVAVLSVQLPVVTDKKSFWHCNHLVNKALIASKRRGGGPVHLNLPTSYMGTFGTKTLPDVKAIQYFSYKNEFSEIEDKEKICIFIGSHQKMNSYEVEAIDNFCKYYDAVVLCDHTSSYNGLYRIQSALAAENLKVDNPFFKELKPDLIIHIGEISGDYSSTGFLERSQAEVWRISPDGEVRDLFKRLTRVYECEESYFFTSMTGNSSNKSNYKKLWANYLKGLNQKVESLDIPFSNIWLNKEFSKKVPDQSTLHFGILNSLRSANFFEYSSSVETMSNVGGFGIDGCLSTLVGASLVEEDKLAFCLLGDSAFFYDMNVMGNRHISSNLRILMVNNQGATEFKNYNHMGAKLGDGADDFVAAANHFLGKNKQNISPAQAWSESLGFLYYSASTKKEFETYINAFVENSDKPILFECFTNFTDESDALKIFSNLDNNLSLKGKVKERLKEQLSDSAKQKIKKVLGR